MVVRQSDILTNAMPCIFKLNCLKRIIIVMLMMIVIIIKILIMVIIIIIIIIFYKMTVQLLI